MLKCAGKKTFAEVETMKAEKTDPLLQELVALPLKERIAVVAKDVRTKTDKFRPIPAHDLATALEVPQPEQPSNDWTFVTYAEKNTLEEYAKTQFPVSEFVYFLENKVSNDRFNELKQKFERLDKVKRPSFAFLTRAERQTIEAAINQERLQSNLDNGISGLAFYSIEQRGTKLRFQGDIEDDGHCITLRTPYYQRDGKFIDLSSCVTDSY
jgi:hypothetical protein